MRFYVDRNFKTGDGLGSGTGTHTHTSINALILVLDNIYFVIVILDRRSAEFNKVNFNEHILGMRNKHSAKRIKCIII